MGASRRHKVVNMASHLIDPKKRYLWSLHPHGPLMDGWHSLVARNSDSFAQDANGPPGIGRKIALCLAPVVGHVPVHGEMFRVGICPSLELRIGILVRPLVIRVDREASCFCVSGESRVRFSPPDPPWQSLS